ncbi:MAG TPA: hypothetical protein VNF51_00485 [Candidatus Paceibacterota bacterium]|nr:hypothetical protein [Candidatus Paceibacterota bacterium]
MRTYLTVGAIGVIMALALSTTVAFAQAGSRGLAQNVGRQYQSPGAATTGALGRPASRSSYERRPSAVGQSGPGRGFAGMSSSTMESMGAAGQARAMQMHIMVEQRLAAIQDRVKQQLVENLSGAFDRINKAWTDHFSQLLDRYAAILQKIQDRANTASASGKNITATNAAIQAAQTAIASARTAVAAQAAKTYTPDFSSSSTTTAIATSTSSGQQEIMQGFRTGFETLRQQLFGDLSALRDGPMTSVRTAVQGAFQALTQIPGVDQVTATSTESSTTSTSTGQ